MACAARLLLCLGMALALAAPEAMAQGLPKRAGVWDVPLGTAAAAIPDEFIDYAVSGAHRCDIAAAGRDQHRGRQRIEARLDRRIPGCVAGGGNQHGGKDEGVQLRLAHLDPTTECAAALQFRRRCRDGTTARK